MVEAKTTATRPITEEGDFLQIKSIDHIHFWVGNAKQAMYYWWKAFGFKPVAYSGLETGNRDYASYVLESGKIRLVVSAPYGPSNAIAGHHLVHGDGVKIVALGVEDVEQAFKETTSRGGVAAWALKEERDDFGIYRSSAIQAYGEVLHVFVDRDDYTGPFAPGYAPIDYPAESTGLAAVDHVVGNVELGKMNYWVNFYHQVMGFRQLLHFDDKDISTEYSALMSKVMQDGSGQIEEYLNYNLTPGVQHLALATGDIIQTVTQLTERGVEFLRVPDAYYQALPERVGDIKESIQAIQELGILVDRDDEGYLLQIFSKPLQDRPTAFIEVIQRRGSRGFGKGNFKALFEAIEAEQDRRGNL